MILDFSKPLYMLAPLAGFTDLPFRSVAKKFGADLTVSEMISSNALAYGSTKSQKMLQKDKRETPYSIQIAGSEPDILKRALDVINPLEGVDIIDLNCGCPVPKVVNNLQGSALLTDLDKMYKAITTIKEYSNKDMLSVKIRLGFTEKNHIKIAKVCQDAGADFIVVHGRTRSGRFKSPVDYNAIAEVKSTLDIPVIANGDIDSLSKAKWVLKHTKCDGVMIGRGAVGKPWIFHQLKNNSDKIDSSLIHDVVLEHFDKMIEYYGEYGVILFRKHLHTYSKVGYKGASQFRNTINTITDPQKTRDEIDRFFAQSLNFEDRDTNSYNLECQLD